VVHSVVIIGSGGHARVVADACRAAGRKVRGFLDPGVVPGTCVGGISVLGGDELLDDPTFATSHEFLVGIGDQRTRRALAMLVREKGAILTTAVHPSAVVAPDVRVGDGTVIIAGSVVNPGAKLGEFVVVNTGATVDHDCILGDGVHVCPGAHLAGGVTCGEDTLVGTGAAVIPGLTIGARSVVGAGAVVICDIPGNVTVVGCPARILTKHRP
jgi:sugar O-acyltransferase (sialic acid O-acetyltransferase NeuD family)